MRVIQSFWPSNETVKEPNNTTSLQLSSEVPPIVLIFMAAVLCCVTPRLGGEDAIASECFDTWTWRSYVSSILFSQPPAHLLQYTLCVLCWPLLDSLWPPYFQQRRCKPSPSCWLHLSVSFVGNRIHTVLQSVKRERLRGGAYSSNLVVFTHLNVLILQFQLCNWVCWQGNKSSFSYSVMFALFCCFMFDVGGEGRLSKQNIFNKMHIYDITVWIRALPYWGETPVAWCASQSPWLAAKVRAEQNSEQIQLQRRLLICRGDRCDPVLTACF